LIPSVAARLPITPGSGPSTPAVSQVSTPPAGGGWTKMHRRHGVSPGTIGMTTP
jgi:hypothetical protein